MSRAPTLTIAGCTRNRGSLVQRALESILIEVQASSVAADPDLEILVVDNGSSDDTAERLRELSLGEPRLRVVHESTPGISVARNRALHEARGELILWFDDDVTVRPGWLDAHLDVYRAHPECVAVGGAVELDFEAPRPAWLGPRMEPNLAGYHLDAEYTGRASPTDVLPYGANMSTRREAIIGVGGFDGALGRVDQSLISGEETAVLMALREQGDALWLTGMARVFHHVPAERSTMRWMTRRSYGQGRTDQRMQGRMLFPEAAARFVFGGFRYVVINWRAPRQTAAEYVCQRAYWLGRMAEMLSGYRLAIARRR